LAISDTPRKSQPKAVANQDAPATRNAIGRFSRARGDLVAVQRHQVELISSPQSRRVTAGLVADLVNDPELADIYVNQYLIPRRATVWQVLQRGVERGELVADTDFTFVYDLLMGPLFMRAVVWGQPLADDAAERTVDVVLAAYDTSHDAGSGS
jgi:Tetracyclin repressor-like, C-terminal domain